MGTMAPTSFIGMVANAVLRCSGIRIMPTFSIPVIPFRSSGVWANRRSSIPICLICPCGGIVLCSSDIVLSSCVFFTSPPSPLLEKERGEQKPGFTSARVGGQRAAGPTTAGFSLPGGLGLHWRRRSRNTGVEDAGKIKGGGEGRNSRGHVEQKRAVDSVALIEQAPVAGVCWEGDRAMKSRRNVHPVMRRVAGWMAAIFAVSSVAPVGIAGGAVPAQSTRRTLPPTAFGSGLRPGNETRTAAIASGEVALPFNLAGGKPGALYSLSVAARDPNALRQRAALTVSVRIGGNVVASKWLHQADPDFYLVFRADDPRAPTLLDFKGEVNGPSAVFTIALRPLPSGQKDVVIEAEPNSSWQEAQPVPLGATVIGTADDRSYYIAPGQNEAEALRAGEDWFKFEQPSDQPKLVFFNLEILDRDVPANILVYTVQDGKLVPYTEGVDPVSGPHEAQVAPTLHQNGVELNSANKFTTRVLKRGTYYVQVAANHPAYRLRTLVTDPPPYKDPHKAIRAAMDYIIAAGDSWFANTPRSGAVARRDRQVHAETALCVASHPSTRGELTAYQNGYPILQRESLRFVAERLYNNPRPFYGPFGASWVRVISAAATVQSRMAQMLLDYETLTGEHRASFYKPIVAYLHHYYQRPAFQPDETEQNPPSISNFETGWMVWSDLNRLSRLPHAAPDLKAERDKVGALMARTPESADGPRTAAATAPASVGTEIKNVDDLCFQTIALAEMERPSPPYPLSHAAGEGIGAEGSRRRATLLPTPYALHPTRGGEGRYSARLRANVEKIFAAQRPDGLWPYNYGENQPTCEFQTGAALYALAKAGVPNTEPHVRKAVEALLARQKPFGAWNTDGQPYEAFNTPFKETQLVLMGLSALFPGPGAKGWTNGQQPSQIRTGRADQTLADLIAIWDKPTPALLGQLRTLTRSPEPLVRLEAVNALCRLADPRAVPELAAALGDDTNMVRRAAAQGLREVITRNADRGTNGPALSALAAVLQSPRAIVRRAALRAFNQHFRWLTRYDALLDRVLAIAAQESDPVARMEAAQALTMWWYWNDDMRARGRILDTVLAALGDEKASAYARGAFRETLYNIRDEDIQYFYNFWTPLLPQEADRKAAIAGFEKVMALQAEKIAAVLRRATPFQTRQIVMGLTEYPIMRAWNPADQVERNFYRIGNDLDAIDFRGPGAQALRPVILMLLGNSEPGIRQRALVMATYLRSNGGQPLIANAIAARLNDGNRDVRQLALQAHRIYPFSTQQIQFGLDPRRFTDENDPNYNADTLPLLTGLLHSPRSETQANALRFLSEFGAKIETNVPIMEKARHLAMTGDLQAKAAAFEIARYLPALRADAQFQAAVAEVLKTAPAGNAARSAALRLALVDSLGQTEAVAPALEVILQSKRPEDQADALALARSAEAIRDDPRLIPLYDNALAQDTDLRGQALQLLKQSKAQASNPAIRVALQAVAQAGSEGHKALAAAILSGQTGRHGDPEKLLDREYFAVKVQPLLAAKGPDGKSCFNCHSNHTILNLQPPDSR